MNSLATISAFIAFTTLANAQVQFGPAEAGEPAVVAFKVINGNFEIADCPAVKDAIRLEDRSVYAICSNGERFRVYGKTSIKCSAAEKLGVSGCDNTPVPSVGSSQQIAMPPIGAGFPGGKPLDIVGIYPGMKYDQAFSMVSDYLQSPPHSFTRLNPTLGGLYVNAVAGGKPNSDNLTVWLTPEAAGNQVIAIGRSLNFNGPGKTSEIELFNALKAKYGVPGRVFNRYGESYNHSTVPPTSDYSLRWVFNSDNKQTEFCLRTQLSHYENRGVFLDSLHFDFYSERSGCGVILEITISKSTLENSVNSMAVLMIDFERTAKAMLVAETLEQKKRREEKRQNLPPPKL